MADYQLLDKIDLRNVLDRFERNLLSKLNCSKVGKIVSFDSAKQQAVIQIDKFPQISGVPVKFICGADFSIQIPVKAGDDCLVIFCDTDLDNWVAGKGGKPAFSQDLHGLNGAIALVGITNLNTKISDYITDGVRIKYKGSSIELKDSGIIIKGNVTVEGDVVADGISLKNHIHSSGTYTNSGGAVEGVSGTPEEGA